MFNWFKDMRRKQKESDRILEITIQDRQIQLKNNAMSLIMNCKDTIKDTMAKHKITQKDLDAYVLEDENGK